MGTDSNDIFISYAWADNEPPTGAANPQTDRWVWQFELALTTALRGKLGTPRQVWIDRREVNANERIQGVLTEELGKSRLLVVLMSPSWSQSTWCRTELETFLAGHPGDARREQVFVVEIKPVARERWHERIRSLAAFGFHKPLAKGKGTVPLGYPLPDPRYDRDFYLDVIALAEQIAGVLEEPAPAAPPAPAPPPAVPQALGTAVPVPATAVPAPAATAAAIAAPPPERVVWIADPTDDLQRKRRELRDAIKAAGFDAITPAIDDLLRSAQGPVPQLLARGMAGAGMFIQLLGAPAGRSDADGRSWQRVQAELARAAAAQGDWPFLAWRDIGTQADDNDQDHSQLLQGAAEMGFEQFRRELLALLPVQRKAAAPAVAGRPEICVTCSEEDQALSEQVLGMLDDLRVEWTQFTNGGSPLPAATGDSAEDRALTESAGIVIVYGAADPNWLVTKVQRAKRLRGLRDRTWGAVVDSPLAGRAPAPRSRSIERHDWAAGPRFDLMKSFIEAIGVQPDV